MAEEIIPDYWPKSFAKDAQAAGMDLRDNPQSALPPLAGWGQNQEPTGRDTLISALMGMRGSNQAVQEASRTGDPLAAAFAAISGAASQPGPDAIAAQRQQIEAHRRLAMMEQMPVEAISPGLAQAHPELKGLPLAVVERIAPIIERAQAFTDSHYNLDQAAQIMSPDQTPAAITQTKARLAQVYPKGFVPKDFAHVAATNNRMEFAVGEKQSQLNQKRLVQLGESLDPSKARAGAFGVSKQVFDRAERLQTMAAAAQGNPDSRQMEELAIGVNAMLSGSNTGAAEQVKALVPQSLVGNAKKFQEWLTNNPTGTEQQAFVKRLLDTVGREKNTAAAQIRRTQFERISQAGDLATQEPIAFMNTLQSHGIDPDEYFSWKKGGFKPISAVGGGSTASDPLGIR